MKRMEGWRHSGKVKDLLKSLRIMESLKKTKTEL